MGNCLSRTNAAADPPSKGTPAPPPPPPPRIASQHESGSSSSPSHHRPGPPTSAFAHTQAPGLVASAIPPPPDSKVYTSQMFGKFRQYAPFTPTGVVKLGDYGRIDRETGRFSASGNIFDDYKELEGIVGKQTKTRQETYYNLAPGKVDGVRDISANAFKRKADVDYAFQRTWRFSEGRHAILILINPELVMLPYAARIADFLKEKDREKFEHLAVVTELTECKSFARILTSGRPGQVSLAYRGTWEKNSGDAAWHSSPNESRWVPLIILQTIGSPGSDLPVTRMHVSKRSERPASASVDVALLQANSAIGRQTSRQGMRHSGDDQEADGVSEHSSPSNISHVSQPSQHKDSSSSHRRDPHVNDGHSTIIADKANASDASGIRRPKPSLYGTPSPSIPAYPPLAPDNSPTRPKPRTSYDLIDFSNPDYSQLTRRDVVGPDLTNRIPVNGSVQGGAQSAKSTNAPTSYRPAESQVASGSSYHGNLPQAYVPSRSNSRDNRTLNGHRNVNGATAEYDAPGFMPSTNNTGIDKDLQAVYGQSPLKGYSNSIDPHSLPSHSRESNAGVPDTSGHTKGGGNTTGARLDSRTGSGSLQTNGTVNGKFVSPSPYHSLSSGASNPPAFTEQTTSIPMSELTRVQTSDSISSSSSYAPSEVIPINGRNSGRSNEPRFHQESYDKLRSGQHQSAQRSELRAESSMGLFRGEDMRGGGGISGSRYDLQSHNVSSNRQGGVNGSFSPPSNYSSQLTTPPDLSSDYIGEYPRVDQNWSRKNMPQNSSIEPRPVGYSESRANAQGTEIPVPRAVHHRSSKDVATYNDMTNIHRLSSQRPEQSQSQVSTTQRDSRATNAHFMPSSQEIRNKRSKDLGSYDNLASSNKLLNVSSPVHPTDSRLATMSGMSSSGTRMAGGVVKYDIMIADLDTNVSSHSSRRSLDWATVSQTRDGRLT